MPTAGTIYKGKVTSIKEFGAFVEFMPQTEGLVHISEWAWERTASLEGIARAGMEIDVKLVEVDERTGKFRLSRKALLPKPEGLVEEPQGERPMRREFNGGDRGGDRGGRRDDRGPRR